MLELSLREIQLAEYKILKKVASICETQGFRYYLCYGTLIGAVRHQGFIPWDDDIDIVMPREDYEKLLAYCESNKDALFPFRCVNYRNNRKFLYPITRICDNRYLVASDRWKEYDFGLFIDIYPLDGMGNTKEETEKIYNETQNDISIVLSSDLKKFKKSPNGFFRNIFKWVLYQYTQIFGNNTFLRRLDEYAIKHPYDKSKYVGCCCWCMGLRYVHERDWFNETIKVKFEDSEFYAPKEYDKLLKSAYGDYMKLPPEEDRKGHHYYTAYKKD